MTERKKRRGILDDHRKVGKRFIPPWMDQMGPLRETSWVEVTMPELLWIACLHAAEGLAQGAALAAALSKASLEQRPKSKTWFAAASSYYELSEDERLVVVETMKAQNCLAGLQRSLNALHYFYPESPFGFLFPDGCTAPSDRAKTLESLKEVLSQLYDKTTRDAIMTQGTAVYLGFVNERLKVAAHTALADFPELERYPDTDKSRMVAAAVRSAIPMVVLPPGDDYESEWSRYFWNRGLQLEKCQDIL